MKIKKFDSINVVPFIDIMLVLLVIVLTTATFIQKGVIVVDVPTASTSDKQQLKKDILIHIDKDNKIYFDNKLVSIDEVDVILKEKDNTTPIKLECDKNAKFECFVDVLDRLRINEYKNLGIVTNEK